MRYWWVSQNQTYKQEISGGYMWSPKSGRNDTKVQSYLNMKEVALGDVIFSYYKGRLQRVGIASGVAFSSMKPAEFANYGKNWSEIGWTVPVTWFEPDEKITPKEKIDLIAPLLPQKHSPLNKSGSGNQAYLFELSTKLGDFLLKLCQVKHDDLNAAFLAQSNNSKAYINSEDAIEKLVNADNDLSSTEKESIILARRGQGRFRSNLSQIECQCRISGIADPRFLVASHIKPWVSCDSHFERLDGNNGLLLSPNMDKLFDSGLISFEANGNIITSSLVEKIVLSSLGLDSGRLKNVGPFTKSQDVYLSFHRENIFKP